MPGSAEQREANHNGGNSAGVSDVVGALRGLLSPQTQSVTVTVNAGGFAVWLTSLAAVLCAGIAIDAKHDIRELRDEVRVMQAHLSAIYMQAPHLKPKDEAE